MMRILRAAGTGTPISRALTVSVAAAVVVGMPALAGCGSLSRDDPPCLPPGYSADPSEVRIGDQVTVSAADADCDPSYGQDARINITVTDASGGEVLNTTAPMNDAGGFSFVFRVPAGTVGRDLRAEAGPMPFSIRPTADACRGDKLSARPRRRPSLPGSYRVVRPSTTRHDCQAVLAEPSMTDRAMTAPCSRRS